MILGPWTSQRAVHGSFHFCHVLHLFYHPNNHLLKLLKQFCPSLSNLHEVRVISEYRKHARNMPSFPALPAERVVFYKSFLPASGKGRGPLATESDYNPLLAKHLFSMQICTPRGQFNLQQQMLACSTMKYSTCLSLRHWIARKSSVCP